MSPVTAHLSQAIFQLDFGDGTAGERVLERAKPPIDWLYSREVARLLDRALTCIFVDSDFASRVKNALWMLHYSDAHSNDAISLSFCVSALEAIHSDAPYDVKKQLIPRVPALLQSAPALASESEKAIRVLYSARSACLHGSGFFAKPGHLLAARRLAAAVLRGMLEWSLNRKNSKHSLPSDEEWVAVLPQVNADLHALSAVPGVTPELSEHLEQFQKLFGNDPLSREVGDNY
jgi:hypothetical protein